MDAASAAQRLGETGYGRDKDIADLQRLFGVRTIDTVYVREWLAKMPVGQDRRAILDDLVRRFAQGSNA